jgi:hypothetical protein
MVLSFNIISHYLLFQLRYVFSNYWHSSSNDTRYPSYYTNSEREMKIIFVCLFYAEDNYSNQSKDTCKIKN